MSTAFIQLGRVGDIINMLPAVRGLGRKASVYVLLEYAPLLEGCADYVEAIPVKGRINHVLPHVAAALERHSDVRVPQVYREERITREELSYNEDSLKRAVLGGGCCTEIWTNRNKSREADLVRQYAPKGKFIITNSKGVSQPFSKNLWAEFQYAAREADMTILDVGNIRAHRFYDLLGLYDQAEMVITTDTATLHLAHLHGVKTVGIVADSPDGWFASHFWHVPAEMVVYYSDFDLRKGEIEDVILGNVSEELVHITCPYGDGKELRERIARRSWENECATPSPQSGKPIVRDGWERAFPTVKSILDAGLAASPNADFFCFTNNDTIFAGGTKRRVVEALRKYSAVYAHRWDFTNLDNQIPWMRVGKGRWYPGVDLIAFTRQWWMSVRDEFPDLILGREGWDCVMRMLIKSTGGDEVHKTIYHQVHGSEWSRNRYTSPSNIYNRSLSRRWLLDNGYDPKPHGL
jgi:hypothetical protein